MSIQNIRRDYTRASLDESNVADHPHDQFICWFNDVLEDDSFTDPTAMVIASSTAKGEVSQRVVLLKDSSAKGYTFFTNYESRKSMTLIEQPKCSLHFAWLHAERQISIEGVATQLSSADNDAYFDSRPRASQLGAWASHQSQPIESRSELVDAFKRAEQQFADQEQVPRPDYWGGFIIEPIRYEFWQGGAARLHDRIEYTRDTPRKWLKRRLQP